MKVWAIILLLLLIALQVKLWVGEGGLKDVRRLEQAVAQQQATNEKLAERNRALAGEARDLKHGLEAVEERARSELGMIREGETFYQVIEPAPATDAEGMDGP